MFRSLSAYEARKILITSMVRTTLAQKYLLTCRQWESLEIMKDLVFGFSWTNAKKTSRVLGERKVY